MKTKIPSPVLARLQLMFQSGATLSDVTAALDLDTTWQEPAPSTPQTTVKDKTPVVAAGPLPSPANDARLPRVSELATQLEAHIAALLEREDVRDLPALAGSLDAIGQHAIAIRKEITTPVSTANTAAPVPTTNRPAQKQKVAAPKKPAAPPPAMKVPAPKKAAAPKPAPKSAQSLKPTESLPAAAKRRAAAHPFAASLQNERNQTKQPAQPQAAPPTQSAMPEPLMAVDQPANAFRDRIASAMNQISSIADTRSHDAEPAAARRR